MTDIDELARRVEAALNWRDVGGVYPSSTDAKSALRRLSNPTAITEQE